jgi:hypothetical protein
MPPPPQAIPAASILTLACALIAGPGAAGSSAQSVPPLTDPPGTVPANPHPTFLAHGAVEPLGGVLYEGQTFAVRFVAERDAYLYLLYHQADGRTLLLFPNPVRPDSRILARQAVRVPAPGEPFRFRVRPPFGAEVLQVLATTRPLDALDRLTGQRRSPEVDPGLLAALRDRLAREPAPWAEHRVAIRTLPFSDRIPDRPPARAGLFIGIAQYLHPENAPTHAELRHSAEVLHEQMLKRGGLDPARTKLVVDQQATRAQLEALITRWLPSVTQPGDVVFLYFSGHAGQTPNRDGTEADGMDEMIGPYDLNVGTRAMSRAEREARFRDSNIVDDVLARWLEELSGRRVVLILDTCHSGGVVEGKGLRNLLADEAARVKDIAQLDVTVLTSCASDEQSLFEGTPNQTMWFTYFLAEAVEKLPAPVTVQAAFDYCKAGLRKLLEKRREARDQEPTLTETGLLPIALVP